MKNKGITRCILSVFIAVVFACCLHSSGLALTNEEVFSQFQFNFITPGARATAMGGAFIGLADDATAVESNPAGLTQLLKPEVSAEFKYITYTTEQILENINYWTDIRRKDFDNSITSVPFLSIVYPYKWFVFSAYRQELVNYESSYRTGAEYINIPQTKFAIYPIDASVDLTVANYGIGAAVQILESLSLAVSPRWSQMDMKSHTTRFGEFCWDEEYWCVSTDFSTDDIFFETIVDDEGGGFSVNAGVIWSPHPRVSIGAVYKRGVTFTITETRGRDTFGFSVLDPGKPEDYDPDLATLTLKVPDSFGAGLAFRITDVLTCTFDIVHIQYEDLLKDFDIFLFRDTYTKDNYTVDNVTEFHVGVEYVLLDERLLALRAGVYYEPDHTIRFTGTTGDDVYDAAGKALFPGGKDQIHVTGGLGLVLSDYFQIDAAANIADNNTQFSVSVVYRF